MEIAKPNLPSVQVRQCEIRGGLPDPSLGGALCHLPPLLAKRCIWVVYEQLGAERFTKAGHLKHYLTVESIALILSVLANHAAPVVDPVCRCCPALKADLH